MARPKQAKTKPKAAAKAKAKTKVKAAKQAAKPRPKLEHVDDDHEPTDTELMLQTLACPTATAERMCEICVDTIRVVKEDIAGIAAAELVWRERPDRQALGSAVQLLVGELERHAQVMLAVYDQVRAIADDDADHADLEIPDVISRLRPMLDALPPED